MNTLQSKIDTRREELFGTGTPVTWDKVFFYGFLAGASVIAIVFCLCSYFTR